MTKKLKIHPVTLWRWRRDGNFPKPVRLGARLIGFRASDIEAWLNRNQSSDTESGVQPQAQRAAPDCGKGLERPFTANWQPSLKEMPSSSR